MTKTEQQTSQWASDQEQATKILGLWTAAWVVTLAIATFGSLLVWESNTVLKVFSAGLNLVIGFKMILANKRHLQSLDELQQKIHLEGMALSLGISMISGITASLLDQIGLLPFRAEIAYIVMIMGVVYGGTVFVLTRRYS